METKRVLIIEDDLEICDLLSLHLKDLSCDVEIANDGKVGLTLATKNPPSLIILDIRLPSMDGIEVCKKLRASGVVTPIIMLTARTEEIDRVLGLEVGADDYITKPFSIREFLARVKAIFRRSSIIQEQFNSDANKSTNMLQFEGISIDIEHRKVLVQNEKVELSPKEFELLVLLASNPGKSYNRERLLNLIWGYNFEGFAHTVNSHINRLRSKIEPDIHNPTFILTTWGVGYKFNEEIKK